MKLARLIVAAFGSMVTLAALPELAPAQVASAAGRFVRPEVRSWLIIYDREDRGPVAPTHGTLVIDRSGAVSLVETAASGRTLMRGALEAEEVLGIERLLAKLVPAAPDSKGGAAWAGSRRISYDKGGVRVELELAMAKPDARAIARRLDEVAAGLKSGLLVTTNKLFEAKVKLPDASGLAASGMTIVRDRGVKIRWMIDEAGRRTILSEVAADADAPDLVARAAPPMSGTRGGPAIDKPARSLVVRERAATGPGPMIETHPFADHTATAHDRAVLTELLWH